MPTRHLHGGPWIPVPWQCSQHLEKSARIDKNLRGLTRVAFMAMAACSKRGTGLSAIVFRQQIVLWEVQHCHANDAMMVAGD